MIRFKDVRTSRLQDNANQGFNERSSECTTVPDTRSIASYTNTHKHIHTSTRVYIFSVIFFFIFDIYLFSYYFDFLFFIKLIFSLKNHDSLKTFFFSLLYHYFYFHVYTLTFFPLIHQQLSPSVFFLSFLLSFLLCFFL